MFANSTGASNVAIGADSLKANTTASNNTGVGKSALQANTTGSENSAVGQNALDSNTTGTANTCVGQASLSAATTGSSNIGIGVDAGVTLTTGTNNVLIGKLAGSYDGNDITTGTNNVLVGNFNKVSAADAANQIVLGYYVTSTGNNNFTFGNSTTDSNISFGATSITAPSDIRLKENIQDEEVGLDFINDLRPVTFQWKKEKDIPSDMKAYKEGSETRTMNGKYNHGFIAQEVKEVIDNYNLKEGFEMWKEDEADGRQRLGEAALMPMMVKAIQELSAKIEELEAQINGE